MKKMYEIKFFYGGLDENICCNASEEEKNKILKSFEECCGIITLPLLLGGTMYINIKNIICITVKEITSDND